MSTDLKAILAFWLKLLYLVLSFRDANSISYRGRDVADLTKIEHNIKCGTVPLFQYKNNRAKCSSHRIIGGQYAQPGEWPWMAHIYDSTGVCSGVLMSSRWILTAGHCENYNSTLDYTVWIGEYDPSNPEDGRATKRRVDKSVRYPMYENGYRNDLMLLRLNEEVEYDDFLQPICLVPSVSDIFEYTKNKICYVLGYGDNGDKRLIMKLKKLRIEAKEQLTHCKNETFQLNIGPKGVCIVPHESREGNLCPGDSGGPSVCYDPLEKHWVVFAIHTGTAVYGPGYDDKRCSMDLLHRFNSWFAAAMDLSRYRNWIIDTIREG